MVQIFVSYSRSDSAKVKKLIPLLRDYYGVDNVWWDQNFYGGQVWWEEIKQEIAQCSVFVFLMSPRSLGSPYCLAELEEARRIRKSILYVKIRRTTHVPDNIAQLHFIHLTGRVNRGTIAPLVRSITEYINHPPSTLPPITSESVPFPNVTGGEQRNYLEEYASQIIIGLMVTLVGGVFLAWIIQADRFAPSPNLDSTASIAQNPIATNTTSLTSTNTPDPLQVAFMSVTRNPDWTPIERDFDGVAMVLVPSGCFMMGSNDSSDQQPIHEQCLDSPVWIDKYEVTQAQFLRLGGTQANSPGFSGDDRPVENITWYEARNYCALREARLPTEAEWEYAARGPDNLVYPWGDTWDANNAVWNRTGSQTTANVGSIPTGVSWVGALDMSGNVWEWTSSLYESYPYDAADGREADTGSRTDVQRVLRGGSWGNLFSVSLRASVRFRLLPNVAYNDYGLRCARSHE